MAARMLCLKVFLPGRVLETYAERFSTIMRMLPVKTQVFGLNNVTGHRNGAAECQVLFSGGLDNLRVSKWEITM